METILVPSGETSKEGRRATLQSAFGLRVRKLRDQLGVSQDGLARRMGRDRKQVLRLEQGNAPIAIDLIEDLGHALGVRPVDLVQGVLDDPSTAPDTEIVDPEELQKRAFKIAQARGLREFEAALGV